MTGVTGDLVEEFALFSGVEAFIDSTVECRDGCGIRTARQKVPDGVACDVPDGAVGTYRI